MSGIAALEHLVGPLSEMYARLGKAWTPEMQAVQSKVGKFFQGLAEDPAYAATSRDIPKGDDRGMARVLARKYGIDPDHLHTEDGMLTHRPSGASISPIGDTPLTLAAALRNAPEFRQATLMDRIKFAKDAGMSPSGDFNAIDMMGAKEGSGMAKTLYPLFTDWLLAHPGSAALNLGLSNSNVQKKALYQAMAAEKYGDRGRNLMQMAPEQLDAAWGKFHNERPFQKSDTPTQIGALNMAIGNNTTAKIHELMRLSDEELRSAEMGNSDILTGDDKFNRFDQSYEAAKRLGLGKQFVPSSNTDFARVGDAIGDLSQQLGVARPVGYDTLRRSGITNDILQNPDIDPRDFQGSELIKGLAKAKGGRVEAPRKPFGPLTQCGCAKR
jgi:hypothetical protein